MKKIKLVINARTCDAKKLELLKSKLEDLDLGTIDLKKGELIYDEENTKKVFSIMDEYILNKK